MISNGSLNSFSPALNKISLASRTHVRCQGSLLVKWGPIIGGPKAAKPCENQLKAVIRSKIKCKAAAAMVKHAFLAQNIANYPSIKENETLQQVHVRVHCCSYGSFSFH